MVIGQDRFDAYNDEPVNSRYSAIFSSFRSGDWYDLDESEKEMLIGIIVTLKHNLTESNITPITHMLMVSVE